MFVRSRASKNSRRGKKLVEKMFCYYGDFTFTTPHTFRLYPESRSLHFYVPRIFFAVFIAVDGCELVTSVGREEICLLKLPWYQLSLRSSFYLNTLQQALKPDVLAVERISWEFINREKIKLRKKSH